MTTFNLTVRRIFLCTDGRDASAFVARLGATMGAAESFGILALASGFPILGVLLAGFLVTRQRPLSSIGRDNGPAGGRAGSLAGGRTSRFAGHNS